MRLLAVEGKEVGLDVASKTLHEAEGLEVWMHKAAAALMRMCAKDPIQFQARSKGVGLICVRPDGIPAGTYLGPYCGEVYPGWRWFEKEVAEQAVRRDVRDDAGVPIFYNAAVERDGSDPRGYDVLFIDGAVKGSLLSRASHSCEPNAEMRIRVRAGAYAVEMVTTQKVSYGEEVCWDYQCKTDSREEMEGAICYCGSQGCRVSYLHYCGASDLASHLRGRGTPAHATAALLRACGPHTSLNPRPHACLANAATPAAVAAATSVPRSGGGRPKKGDERIKAKAKAEVEAEAEAEASAGDGGDTGADGASNEEVDDERAVVQALAVKGLKEGDQGDAPGLLRGLPLWAKRFAASCVAYIAEEKVALAETLAATAMATAAEARASAAAAVMDAEAMDAAATAGGEDTKGKDVKDGRSTKAKARASPPPPQTAEEAAAEAAAAKIQAEAEAAGVADGRVQSLAVTLDKVRHVLAVQLGGDDDARIAAAPPPLVALSPPEALQLLNDHVARVVEAAAVALPPAAARRARDAAGARARSLSAARTALRTLAAALWREGSSGDTGAGGGGDSGDEDTWLAAAKAAYSAGDLCYLTAETKTFFRALPGPAFTSPYVQVGSTAGTYR